MPAVRMIEKTIDIEGQDPVKVRHFEMSAKFQADAKRNTTLMKRPDGKVVPVNKKLVATGYYEDHGFKPVKEN